MSTYDKPPAQGEKLNTNYNYPGPHALKKIIQERYPHLRFNGIYAPRTVAGTNTPSAHQVARGVDFSIDDVGKAEATNCFDWLVLVRDRIGIQGVIFDFRIQGFGNDAIRPTHPSGNPHTDHIHFEQTVAGAKMTEAEIRQRLGQGDDDDVTDAQLEKLINKLTDIQRGQDKLIDITFTKLEEVRQAAASGGGGGGVSADAEVSGTLTVRPKS